MILSLINLFNEAVSNNDLLNELKINDDVPNQNDQISYPYCHLNYPFVTSTDGNRHTNETTFYILDRYLEDETNLNQILEKTQLIALSVLNYLHKYHNTAYKTLNYNMLPLVDSFTDRVCGWKIDIQVVIIDNLECYDLFTEPNNIEC